MKSKFIFITFAILTLFFNINAYSKNDPCSLNSTLFSYKIDSGKWKWQINYEWKHIVQKENISSQRFKLNKSGNRFGLFVNLDDVFAKIDPGLSSKDSYYYELSKTLAFYFQDWELWDLENENLVYVIKNDTEGATNTSPMIIIKSVETVAAEMVAKLPSCQEIHNIINSRSKPASSN